jgi:hypothetical protein
MKYCSKCKHLHNDDEQNCNECKCLLSDITDENTPVFILSAGGFELERIKTAFEDNQIPCYAVSQKKNLSADAVTGKSDIDSDLLVPYSAYEKAYDLCVGIGAIDKEDAEILADGISDNENIKSDDEEFEQMSSAKRTTIRVVSAILLIVLFCAVIWGTDFITALIKNYL